jgi:uncharacterized protein
MGRSWRTCGGGQGEDCRVGGTVSIRQPGTSGHYGYWVLICLIVVRAQRRMATLSAQTTAKLIFAYQRFVSPYKGFCCAHRALHGGSSCSEAVRQVVLERGLMGALPSIRARFHACKHAHLVLMAEEENRPKRKKDEKKKDDKCLETLWCLDLGMLPCSCIF